jgi:D-serine deaminase-like pyridoxal phosphate-dependent protein
MRLTDLQTPALVVERAALEANLATMAAALPGSRLRPHVKAHKTTALAKLQLDAGHPGLTCATIRECEGLAAAGLGEDLLLANQVLDCRRLGALDARVTVAVDSEATIVAAAAGGVREVVIDVNVGMPRCGCAPADAGMLADLARASGLSVRGVMGYEGHLMTAELPRRATETEASMALLLDAHAAVGGEIVSAGGTGTYALNTWATEIQAGSYLLMDTAYTAAGMPFEQALTVLATVVSSSPEWAVADCGLKSLARHERNPELPDHRVWFCSDEHTTFSPPMEVGQRVRVHPAHIDPTVALHERIHLVDGDDVLETWPVDLRGW